VSPIVTVQANNLAVEPGKARDFRGGVVLAIDRE
jgi:hypothetical protein